MLDSEMADTFDIDALSVIPDIMSSIPYLDLNGSPALCFRMSILVSKLFFVICDASSNYGLLFRQTKIMTVARRVRSITEDRSCFAAPGSGRLLARSGTLSRNSRA